MPAALVRGWVLALGAAGSGKGSLTPPWKRHKVLQPHRGRRGPACQGIDGLRCGDYPAPVESAGMPDHDAAHSCCDPGHHFRQAAAPESQPGSSRKWLAWPELRAGFGSGSAALAGIAAQRDLPAVMPVRPACAEPTRRQAAALPGKTRETSATDRAPAQGSAPRAQRCCLRAALPRAIPGWRC